MVVSRTLLAVALTLSTPPSALAQAEPQPAEPAPASPAAAKPAEAAKPLVNIYGTLNVNFL